ncbi:hypothetical protein [Saccharothrix hoggarensis]|uniref:Fe-S cluster assembly iron-binding protein IscA n=1 Tax=Saccharothrix hoggarensis TaxID=913853 RepID=A0ABW3QMD3_9PSEU
MSEADVSTWRSRRERLDAVIDSARARVAAAGAELRVQVDPNEEPSPAVTWNWHITCTAEGIEVDVIASQDLAQFAIEDGSGRFEIETDAAGFPEVLTRRLLQ